MAVDWMAVRNEYVSGVGSIRELAAKYGVSKSAVGKRAKAENWQAEREERADKKRTKVGQLILEKQSAEEADRVLALLRTSDRLREKIDEAVDQLYTGTGKRRTVLMMGATQPLDLQEVPVSVKLDHVDRQGLKQLSSALHDLAGIVMPQEGTSGTEAASGIPDGIWRAVMNEKYAEHLTDERPVQIYFGGSSSGKSYAILGQRTVRDLLKGGRNYLICRKTGRTIRGSCYNEIVKAISRMDLDGQFRCNKSDMTVTCTKNGCQAVFCGLDDVEKVKSITPQTGVFTDILIEEATEVDYGDYKQLTKRLRGGDSATGKRMVLLFNPVLQEHWIYKEFFAGKWNDAENEYSSHDLLILRTTYKDNRYLTQEDRDKLENETDKYYYDVYTLGHWGVLGKLIYTNWEIKDLSERLAREAGFRNGMDFGFWPDPNAFVRVGYDRRTREVFVYREAGGNQQDAEQMANMLRPIVHREVVRCDADPFRINELCERGITAVPAVKGPGSVSYGVEWMQRQKIWVDPSCACTIAELRTYKYREDRDGNVLPEPVDRDNHWMDALRYALEEEIIATRVG